MLDLAIHAVSISHPLTFDIIFLLSKRLPETLQHLQTSSVLLLTGLTHLTLPQPLSLLIDYKDSCKSFVLSIQGWIIQEAKVSSSKIKWRTFFLSSLRFFHFAVRFFLHTAHLRKGQTQHVPRIYNKIMPKYLAQQRWVHACSWLKLLLWKSWPDMGSAAAGCVLTPPRVWSWSLHFLSALHRQRWPGLRGLPAPPRLRSSVSLDCTTELHWFTASTDGATPRSVAVAYISR